MMPKFDYIIGNPPYDGNLHLKILDAVKDYGNKLIWLSPVTELVDKRLKFIEPKNIMRREHLYRHLWEMGEVYYSSDMIKLFNVESRVPVAIQIYDFSKENPNFSPDMYVEWIDKEIEKPLLKKIFAKCKESNWENADNGEGDYVLNTPSMNGNIRHVMAKQYDIAIEKSYNPRCREFHFKTDEERRNFHDAYFTSFMIWQTLQWKNTINIYPKIIPYFKDCSIPWTNERLYDYFDLTPEEIMFVQNEIKKMKL